MVTFTGTHKWTWRCVVDFYHGHLPCDCNNQTLRALCTTQTINAKSHSNKRYDVRMQKCRSCHPRDTQHKFHTINMIIVGPRFYMTLATLFSEPACKHYKYSGHRMLSTIISSSFESIKNKKNKNRRNKTITLLHKHWRFVAALVLDRHLRQTILILVRFFLFIDFSIPLICFIHCGKWLFAMYARSVVEM